MGLSDETIAILGSGQVGRALHAALAYRNGVRAALLGHQEADVTNYEELRNRLEKVRPTLVFNAAAYTRVNDCERDPDTAELVNTTGAWNVMAAAQEIVKDSYINSGKKDLYSDSMVQYVAGSQFAMAAAVNGGIPEFVDILPESGQMDTGQLRDRLEVARQGGTLTRYRAIVPVHLYGHPENMREILEIARAFEVPVIEDACQAHGGWFSLNGKKVMAGTAGLLGCFSFYPTKNLGCFGDGGMVVTNDRELAEQLRMLRNYGQKEARHRHFSVAANNRLDEIQAAWLQVKLPRLDDGNKRRREIAAHYTDQLRDLPVTLPPAEREGDYSVFHLYAIRTEKRPGLMAYLAKNGIDTTVHYPIPIHLQPAFAYLGLAKGSFPHAERFAETVLSLPMYPELTDEEVERVAETVKAFFE